ncbi:MAG: PAS domain S-box protein [Pontiellaceae bacterium]|nr:PAS domain S-box protein [Pontiellaceae bacterium]
MGKKAVSKKSPGRVLLADDHEIYRNTISRLLEREGYQVVGAACGTDVLSEAARQPFDAFILDYKMPGNEELMLAGQIKALQPDVPIIILTGFASLPSVMNAIRLQLFDYIPKDEKPEHLLARIAEAVRHTQLERKLRISEERYRLLAENIQDVISVFSPDIKATYISPSVEPVLGYTPDEFFGMDIYELVHPEDRLHLQNAVTLLLAGHLVKDHELRFRHRNGSYILLATSGEMVSDARGGRKEIVCSSRDVTQRKQERDALQQREAYLSAIIENQPGMVWLKDRESRCLAANYAFIRACGRQKIQEIVGLFDRDIWPVELADKYVRDDQMVMEKKTPMVVEELMTGHDGDRWVETFKSPVFSASGEVIGTTGFAHDITDRKQAEEELRASELRYQNLARHLEVVREEERKRISRELHDDIGQILTALKIDLTQVLEGFDRNGFVKNKMEDMQSLLSNGIQSVHSLCRRLRPGSLDDLSLEDALAGLAEDWRNRNAAECVLYADADDDALSDEIKTAVFRMVQEALTNVSRYAKASRVEINLVMDEQSLSVLIADDGCGLGTGAVDKPASFGLLGIRERMEALGGTLSIESSPGKGMRLEGCIPLPKNCPVSGGL